MPISKPIQVFLCIMGICAVASAQSKNSTPVLTFELVPLFAPEEKVVVEPTLSFLTDNILAVGGCSGASRLCKLAVLALGGDKIRAIAVTDEFAFAASVFRSPDGVLSDRNFRSFRDAAHY